jgi:hypothetical protein
MLIDVSKQGVGYNLFSQNDGIAHRSRNFGYINLLYKNIVYIFSVSNVLQGFR